MSFLSSDTLYNAYRAERDNIGDLDTFGRPLREGT